mgnify:CR=1 FL=1
MSCCTRDILLHVCTILVFVSHVVPETYLYMYQTVEHLREYMDIVSARQTVYTDASPEEVSVQTVDKSR